MAAPTPLNSTLNNISPNLTSDIISGAKTDSIYGAMVSINGTYSANKDNKSVTNYAADGKTLMGFTDTQYRYTANLLISSTVTDFAPDHATVMGCTLINFDSDGKTVTGSTVTSYIYISNTPNTDGDELAVATVVLSSSTYNLYVAGVLSASTATYFATDGKLKIGHNDTTYQYTKGMLSDSTSSYYNLVASLSASVGSSSAYTLIKTIHKKYTADGIAALNSTEVDFAADGKTMLSSAVTTFAADGKTAKDTTVTRYAADGGTVLSTSVSSFAADGGTANLVNTTYLYAVGGLKSTTTNIIQRGHAVGTNTINYAADGKTVTSSTTTYYPYVNGVLNNAQISTVTNLYNASNQLITVATLDANGRYAFYSNYQYSASNQLISVTAFDGNRNQVNSIGYQYNSIDQLTSINNYSIGNAGLSAGKSQLSGTSFYDPNSGKLLGSTSYIYDATWSQLTSARNYNASGQCTGKTVYQYTGARFTLQLASSTTTQVDPNNQSTILSSSTYNSQGNVVTTISYDNKAAKLGSTSNLYNTLNQLIETDSLNVNGAKIGSTIFDPVSGNVTGSTADKYNQVTNQLSEVDIFGSGGKMTSSYTYQYTVDNQPADENQTVFGNSNINQATNVIQTLNNYGATGIVTGTSATSINELISFIAGSNANQGQSTPAITTPLFASGGLGLTLH